MHEKKEQMERNANRGIMTFSAWYNIEEGTRLQNKTVKGQESVPNDKSHLQRMKKQHKQL